MNGLVFVMFLILCILIGISGYSIFKYQALSIKISSIEGIGSDVNKSINNKKRSQINATNLLNQADKNHNNDFDIKPFTISSSSNKYDSIFDIKPYTISKDSSKYDNISSKYDDDISNDSKKNDNN
jgi:hypothetical protein